MHLVRNDIMPEKLSCELHTTDSWNLYQLPWSTSKNVKADEFQVIVKMENNLCKKHGTYNFGDVRNASMESKSKKTKCT